MEEVEEDELVFLEDAVVDDVLDDVLFLEEDEVDEVILSDVVDETLSFQASVTSGGITGGFSEETTAITVIIAVIKISIEIVTYIPRLRGVFF